MPERDFDFQGLGPDLILDSVEAALGVTLTGLTHPLASYINRVYELQAADGTRLIAKFYRPGRWSREALEDEHRFVLDCVEAEIPVIAPLPLQTGGTLGDADGIGFAVYPKRYGRGFELIEDEDWRRFGRMVGRMHLAGSRREAPERLVMHPDHTTCDNVDQLLDDELVAPHLEEQFESIADDILDLITPLFDDREMIRIHGDLHVANILCDGDGHLMLIDFDDMVTGPPVQDLWMMLPDRADRSRREMTLILEGYREFRAFDYSSLQLIEPLRVMRNCYFLSWCGRQLQDPEFRHNFPEWGSQNFWQNEVSQLGRQLQVIREHLNVPFDPPVPEPPDFPDPLDW